MAGWDSTESPDSFYAAFPWKQGICWENSRAKLARKNLDMIVANNLKVEGAGFGTGYKCSVMHHKGQ